MGRYYYARGERIGIAPDARHLAVDGRRAESAGLAPALKGLAARRLPEGVLLVERSDVATSLVEQLRRAAVVMPVYHREEAILVPLPEVRVEIEGAGQREAVMQSLATAGQPTDVSEPVENWLLVRPRSGSGDDAIDLANHLHETAHPAAASVRFLQVVKKPLPGR